MTSKLIQSIRLYIRQETSHVRWQRMWICALTGILAASIFTWTMSTINLITLPSQRLGMDWPRLWFYWGGLSIIAGMEGLFVGWFTEDYEGITFGWVPVELLLLLGYFFYISSVTTDPIIASISIIGLLEATGAFIIFAVILRLIANKFIKYYLEGKTGRGQRTLAFTAGIIFLIILIGSLARYDVSVVKILRSLNQSMAGVTTDPSLETRLPMETVPELRSHLGKPYKIYPRPDTAAVGTYVFAVIFHDGFSFSCRISVTESRPDIYFNDCNQGANLSFP
ncbi:MAG: hypothetical protein C3F13_10790 [Anaerolineales bacterium]|nr:MAG: hypothetical protein C3F13_10790 [Anaerolineales bacterium]